MMDRAWRRIGTSMYKIVSELLHCQHALSQMPLAKNSVGISMDGSVSPLLWSSEGMRSGGEIGDDAEESSSCEYGHTSIFSTLW